MWNARRRASVLRGNTTTSLHWTLIVKYRSFTPSGAQHRFEKLCPSANNAWCWWVTRFKRHINFSSTITTCRSFLANRTRRIRGCRARDSSSQRFEGKKLFVVPLFGVFSYQQDKSDDLRGKTAENLERRTWHTSTSVYISAANGKRDVNFGNLFDWGQHVTKTIVVSFF